MDGFSILILTTCCACLAAAVLAIVRGWGRVDRAWFAVGAVLTAAWLFAVGSVRVSPTTIVALGRAAAAAAIGPLVPVPWLFVTLLLARERGSEHLRRYRLLLVGVVVLSTAAAWAGAADLMVLGIDRTAGAYAIALTSLGRYAALYMMAVCLLSLFNLEVTARAAAPGLLAGVKHALIGIAAAIVYHVFVLSMALLYSSIRLPHLTAGAVPILAALVLVSWSVARRRLDDSRVAVGRPVFYTSLTAFLAGVYLLVLGGAGWVAREQGWGPSLATTTSLVFASVLILVVFIFSTRTRRAIRRFIDTNFYVSRYDYRREWSRTSLALSGVTREGDILSSVLDLMRETFEAEPVVGATLERAAGRVRVRARRGLTSGLAAAVADDELVLALEARSGPIRIAGATLDPLLREWMERHADALGAGSYAVAVPLATNGRIIGVVLISRSASRGPGRYTHEDLLMLEMMGRQAGSTLVASRLAADLSATREMESLHRISSFVVHDLKNSVAGLSMMVRNAENLITDPAFQEDLLESVAETASGIQRVIDRVSGHVGDSASDIGGRIELTRQRMSPARGASFADIATDAARRAGLCTPGCGVLVDVEADGVGGLTDSVAPLRTVLENLLRNAADAMSGAGTVEVRAWSAPDDGLVVRVMDTGPGVPDEIVESGELFAPFRTGSESGLGVGLYQCRTVLEELGGWIELVPGDGGAVFEMWIPAERI